MSNSDGQRRKQFKAPTRRPIGAGEHAVVAPVQPDGARQRFAPERRHEGVATWRSKAMRALPEGLVPPTVRGYGFRIPPPFTAVTQYPAHVWTVAESSGGLVDKDRTSA